MRPPAAGFSFTYETHSRRSSRKRSATPGCVWRRVGQRGAHAGLYRPFRVPPRSPHIPFLADGPHSGPAFRHQRSGPAAGEGRRAVEAAGPVRDREVLVMAELVAAIEHHPRALGGGAVLV